MESACPLQMVKKVVFQGLLSWTEIGYFTVLLWHKHIGNTVFLLEHGFPVQQGNDDSNHRGPKRYCIIFNENYITVYFFWHESIY